MQQNVFLFNAIVTTNKTQAKEEFLQTAFHQEVNEHKVTTGEPKHKVQAQSGMEINIPSNVTDRNCLLQRFTVVSLF